MSFVDAPAEGDAADPVRLALRLLLAIAEDPLIRPSYRVAARRHVRQLEEALNAAT